jgi:hypothetical protein
MFAYRLIIKQALEIAWRHRYLWIFGLFASIVAASGSFEYQLLTGSFQTSILDNSYYYLNVLLSSLEALGLFILGFIDLFSYNILTIINTLTVLIIVTALIGSFLWLSISSQGALVEASKRIITSKKKISNLNLRQLLTIGHQNFWPVLGLNVLIKLAIIVILSIISIPLLILAAKYSTYLTLIYTLAFIIFVPLAIACSLMIKYAIAYKVIDDEDFFSALKKSWHMFRKNWLVSLEMGIILFLISFLVGFILIIALSVVVLPYFIFAIDYGIAWLIILIAIVTLFLVLAVGSFLTTFQIGAWTNIFLELKAGNGQAKLERIFRKKSK